MNNFFDFSKAEFFKKGSIIPQRILRGPRKFKHKVCFGSDSYVLPSKRGYVIACMTKESICGSAISLKCNIYKNRNITLIGSAYHKDSDLSWVVSYQGKDEQIKLLNMLMNRE